MAVASAPGRGAVGVVRVSGPRLQGLARKLLSALPAARHATYGPFRDASGEEIDRGIAIWFPGPHSYTGEDVLELQGHGGPMVMQRLLGRVLSAGAELGLRLARPGEFTERAFLNGKLDLAQAEAVADLIDASSAQAARLAARSLAGEFSRRIGELQAQLTELRALIEATLDFPEEEVDVIATHDVRGRLARLADAVAAVRAEAKRGALMREGMKVVIAGAPNVGKSSLLNALAGMEVAIVTPIAGTTRDRLAQPIQIDGVPIEVIDTAGLRDTDDTVERIGIERAWEAIGRADVVMLVEDATSIERAVRHGLPEPGSSLRWLERARAMAGASGAPLLHVINKVDAVASDAVAPADGTLLLSALTGQGMDTLRTRLLELAGWQSGGEAGFIARARHLEALDAAAVHLRDAVTVLDHGLELCADELALAQRRLGSITGEFTADDLLGEIFGRFCIGK